MKVSNVGMCRGDGKGYIEYLITGVSDSHTLVPSLLTGGNQLPSQFVPMRNISGETDAYVLVIPLLPSTIEVRIAEVDESGNEISNFHERINPEVLKWTSRFNYHFREAFARQIRDIDDAGYFKQINIAFNDVLIDEHENILRGALIFPDQESPEVELVLLDSKAEVLEARIAWTDDRIVKSHTAAHGDLRKLAFSIRIPQKLQTYCLIARDSAGQIPGSYMVLAKQRYKSMLDENWGIMLCDAGCDPDYHEWFMEHRVDRPTLLEQRETQFDDMPLISIIVPLYKTPINLFWEMERSVIDQSYGNFELLLVNASPDDSDLAAAVSEACGDERVRHVELAENMGIAKNTRAGIEATRGEFIAFLDHDDTLEPDALFEYVQAINRQPDIDLLYCDEDKLVKRRFKGPFFKPDYNAFLLRTNNYICHFLTVRKSVLELCEATDSVYDGAQDYDLILKVCEKARRVHHVSRVLYHWRITENSTAGNPDSKPYADEAGRLAAQAHMDRMGRTATVETTDSFCRYRVRYDLTEHPSVSILISDENPAKTLNDCVRSIVDRSTYDSCEILILEYGKTDPSAADDRQALASLSPNIRFVDCGTDSNTSTTVNRGVAESTGEYLLFLDSDTRVITPDFIESMLSICMEDEVGIVGAHLLFNDDTTQHAGIGIMHDRNGVIPVRLNLLLPGDMNGYCGSACSTQEYSAVSSACMMVKRRVFEEIGGFRDIFATVYNGTDFCLLARDAGYKVVYDAEAELYHNEPVVADETDDHERIINFDREAALFSYHWAKYRIQGDSYINPNLDENSRYFKLPDIHSPHEYR